ncbi:ComEC/Rec2 family competence protein [Streptobacillus moniliformis]|uniref:ComEC/Rec2 family competence protein n=1 Tax=Streptobacillus moniliformis TaxID=34105 RepID=UPI0007E49BA3|nr:ComEC/Rec2 family competence protein [Streptobacillus moniliformis]
MKKYLYILSIFILFIFFNLNKFNVDNISYGLIYSLDVKVVGKNINVIKINDKYINKKVFLRNYDDLKYGRYTLSYVWDNKREGRILDVKPSNFNTYRQYILNVIEKSYENFETRLISKAIILGDKSDIDKDTLKTFNYLGIIHLIAISGLHIHLISSIFKNRYISFIFISIYSILIGFSASIKRVYLMKLLDFFDLNKSDVYMISIIVLLLSDIYNIFDQGFIYTFSSVFVLIYIYPLIKANNFSFIYLSLCIQIAITPFSYYFSNTIPIFTFLVNLLMIPIFTLLIEMVFINLILNIFGISFFSILIDKYYKLIMELIYMISRFKYISIEVENFNIYLYIFLIIFSSYILLNIWKEH